MRAARLCALALCTLLSVTALASGGTDINSADQAALEALPGIGPSKAQAIITYRQEHGPFASVDSLDAVPGIGPKSLANLRPLIHAGKSANTAAPSTREEMAQIAPPPAKPRTAVIIQGQGKTRFFDEKGRPIAAGKTGK